jgi:ATP-dependent RNA helicase DeaD
VNSHNNNEQDNASTPHYDFGQLPPVLRENVMRMGWEKPMPVQSAVVPVMLDGKDLIVQSRTGSGKTGAFMLPILSDIEPRRAETQALILVPTRELAEQVRRVVEALSVGTGVRSVAVYGGVGYGPQIEALRNGAQIIVATPGRLLDHLMRDRASLSRLKCLIFDEADEMLSMGFFDSIVRIMAFVPERRQTALFSATIPPGVAKIARKFIKEPVHISLSGDARHVEEVDHIYYVVDPMRKDRSLLKIIEMENPEAALIFCNTKHEVEYLATFLQNFGYDADYISGDLNQRKREQVMKRIREGTLRFLVATDLAARGIDISELGYVIVYDLPPAHDDYIHRAGRTGRAGEGGLAISLVSYLEEYELKKRGETNKLPLIKRELPTDEELQARVSERLMVMLEEKYRALPNSIKERLLRFIPATKAMIAEEDEINLIAMMFDVFYQEILHKPLYTHETQMERDTERRERRTPESNRNSRVSRRRRH